jgi:hypothetical protein
MSLVKFIEGENVLISFFPNGKEPKFPANPRLLTDDEKKRLALCLSRALTPEALTRDGEIRGAKLVTKRNSLLKAKAELEAMGQAVEIW